MSKFRAATIIATIVTGAAATLCAAEGCSADGAPGRRLTVGTEPADPSATRPGSDDAGAVASTGSAGAAGSRPVGAAGTILAPPPTFTNALGVRVEDLTGLSVEIVALRCAGDCADIVAVAHGGNPPYAYVWEDNSLAATRHVCLSASQTLRVKATDTAVPVSEFGYAPQMASAEVTANVLGCSDAGAPPPPGDFCIENPSLEGTPGTNTGTMFELPAWQACSATPDVGPRSALGLGMMKSMQVVASDGATFVGLGADPFATESASGRFCSALTPGRPVSFTVDLRLDQNFSTAPFRLEIWAAATSCAKDELLWTSPSVTAADRWTTYCGTFVPSESFPYILVNAPMAPAAGLGYVEVDNFRAKARCD